MIPLPDDITGDDIDQWLRGGVFLVDGIPYVYSMMDYDYDADGPRVFGYDLNGDSVRFNHKAQKLCVAWPQVGAVNVRDPGYALYVQRRQDRQYRRSYNERCASVHVIGRWELARAGVQQDFPNNALDSRVVKAVFEPWFPPSLAEAFATGWPSVALSPQLTLFPACGTVYYRDIKAGVIDRNGIFTATCDPVVARRINKQIGGLI